MGRAWKIARSVGVSLGFLIVVVALLLWLAGVFEPKISTTGAAQVGVARAVPAGAIIEPVIVVTRERTEPAVGTVEAERQTTIAGRILSRVVSLDIDAGQRVEEGEVLAQLDDTDLRERLEQARAVLNARQANMDQAREELARAERSAEHAAASELEVIRARNVLRAAEADLNGAQRAVQEAEIVLGYTEVRAPFAGVVIDRIAELGDTVTPGQPLLTMYDPGRMQLVASVRESLSAGLEVGEKVGAENESIGLRCEAEVAEIVPEASAQSRSFLVKVTGPCPPGVYPGMFGRIFVPVGEERVLAAPASAVRRVGQLNLVEVVRDDDTLERRSVRLGRTLDGGQVEVLSGLREGERVLIGSEE